MDEQKNSQTNEENDDYIEEEEDEEEELNLIKIKSGEYQVKEKGVPLRAMAVDKDDNKKEKEPQDSIKVTQERSNHKVVEIKHTTKEDDDEKGPKDSVKK